MFGLVELDTESRWPSGRVAKVGWDTLSGPAALAALAAAKASCAMSATTSGGGSDDGPSAVEQDHVGLVAFRVPIAAARKLLLPPAASQHDQTAETARMLGVIAARRREWDAWRVETFVLGGGPLAGTLVTKGMMRFARYALTPRNLVPGPLEGAGNAGRRKPRVIAAAELLPRRATDGDGGDDGGDALTPRNLVPGPLEGAGNAGRRKPRVIAAAELLPRRATDGDGDVIAAAELLLRRATDGDSGDDGGDDTFDQHIAPSISRRKGLSLLQSSLDECVLRPAMIKRTPSSCDERVLPKMSRSAVTMRAPSSSLDEGALSMNGVSSRTGGGEGASSSSSSMQLPPGEATPCPRRWGSMPKISSSSTLLPSAGGAANDSVGFSPVSAIGAAGGSGLDGWSFPSGGWSSRATSMHGGGGAAATGNHLSVSTTSAALRLEVGAMLRIRWGRGRQGSHRKWCWAGRSCACPRARTHKHATVVTFGVAIFRVQVLPSFVTALACAMLQAALAGADATALPSRRASHQPSLRRSSSSSAHGPAAETAEAAVLADARLPSFERRKSHARRRISSGAGDLNETTSQASSNASGGCE